MPKIVDREARRQEIAHKAIEVFLRDGLQDANLGKIAVLCGFGRTTIYQYFRNIDEVLGFTLEEVFSDLDRDARQVLRDESLGAIEKILELLDVFEREAIEDRGRMALLLEFILHPRREFPKAPIDVRERLHGLKAMLERILADGVASGELRELEPRMMAFTIFSLVEAVTLHSTLYEPVALEECLSAARILVEGLKA